MSSINLDGLKVLIVDDERDFALTLADRLALRGIEARTAFSGAEGLDCLRESLADLVLLDMRMPGLSGVEVLREVRVMWPDLPVIVITGHCSEQDFQAAHDLGVNGYHAKPLNFLDLLADIAALRR